MVIASIGNRHLYVTGMIRYMIKLRLHSRGRPFCSLLLKRTHLVALKSDWLNCKQLLEASESKSTLLPPLLLAAPCSGLRSVTGRRRQSLACVTVKAGICHQALCSRQPTATAPAFKRADTVTASLPPVATVWTPAVNCSTAKLAFHSEWVTWICPCCRFLRNVVESESEKPVSELTAGTVTATVVLIHTQVYSYQAIFMAAPVQTYAGERLKVMTAVAQSGTGVTWSDAAPAAQTCLSQHTVDLQLTLCGWEHR